MQYADDICKVSTDYNSIQRFKNEIPKLLTKRDITINESKTEEYEINKNSHDWKKCKYLGSMLDTSEDIKRRKTLAIRSANNLTLIFNNKHLTIKTKTKAFTTYIQPVFLYNCETWTLTKLENEKIGTFQRRLIRKYILNIKWPKTITNEKVYEKTEIEKLSQIARKRRLKFFGNVYEWMKTFQSRKP